VRVVGGAKNTGKPRSIPPPINLLLSSKVQVPFDGAVSAIEVYVGCKSSLPPYLKTLYDRVAQIDAPQAAVDKGEQPPRGKSR